MDVERRSIEFIPECERYGSPTRLFSIWFSANMQVTALIVGAFGVLAGLNIFWGIVAVLFGTAIGTVFMAAHSAQGPHLGIPQMIQSRAQFGVLGAGLPLVTIVIAYILFAAANSVVIRSSIQAAIPLSDNNAIILFGTLTFLIAFVGYELIHRMAIWMSVASLVLFLFVSYFVLVRHYPAGAWSPYVGFGFKAFVLGVMQSASWSLGYAPTVADYSRYLPTRVKTSHTFWYSYVGQFCGAGFVMALGAALAAFVPQLLADPGLQIAGLFPVVGRWAALLVIVLGVLQMNVLNIYSAYMSGTTIFTGFRGMIEISKGHKFLIMACATLIATAIAIATQYSFADYFSDILVGQLYFIVPWTAINLCDFYCIRFGKYSVAEIYNEAGEYGRYNHITIAILVGTIVVEIPFMNLSFYVGPVAKFFGTDMTVLVSLVVPGGLYYWANRHLIISHKASTQASYGT